MQENRPQWSRGFPEAFHLLPLTSPSGVVFSLFSFLSPQMLRKLAAPLLLSLFLALPASAQGLPGLTSVGVKGGASFATLRGDAPDQDLGYKTGFVGGIYGQAEFIPFFTPRIEVLYVQKGASTDVQPDPNLPGGLEGSYNIDYIEIPVLAKVNLPIVNRVFPSLYVGPYIGFPVSQGFEVDDGDEQLEDDFPDDSFSTDYGLVIGTDVDFTFAGKALTLSGRYDLGLANIADDDIFAGDDDIRTGTFMVTLGFGI
ncbi:MAG: hypothetical protein BRD52_04660 [Bacteroidetes bacterium SW_4_67_19]|nr:MAG: hypothetical protein BRD52_04660 [Bacteroidetes bacterium SW_4_67_19]